MDNIPDSGFDDLINFKNNFPDMNFEDAYGEIKFNSNIYEINTEINFEDFVSSSISKLILRAIIMVLLSQEFIMEFDEYDCCISR